MRDAVCAALGAALLIACHGICAAAAINQPGDYSLSISPDGRFVSYTRHVRGGPVGQDLFLHDSATGNTRVFYSGPMPQGAASWSPDGALIALYVNTAQGNIQLQVREVSSGRLVAQSAAAACWLGNCSALPRWTADGRQVLFVAHPPAAESPADGAPAIKAGVPQALSATLLLDRELHAAMPAPGGMTVLSSPAVAAGGKVPTMNDVPIDMDELYDTRRVIALDVRSGRERVLASSAQFTDVRLLGASGRAVVQVQEPAKGRLWRHYSLFVLPLRWKGDAKPPAGPAMLAADRSAQPLDATGRPLRRLMHDAQMYAGEAFSVSPSGRHVAYSTMGPHDGAIKPSGDVFVVDVATARLRNLTAQTDIAAQLQVPDAPLRPKHGAEWVWQERGRFGNAFLAPIWTPREDAVLLVRAAPGTSADVPIVFELWRAPLAGAGRNARRLDCDPQLSVVRLFVCAGSEQPCVTGKSGRLWVKLRNLRTAELSYGVIEVAAGNVRIVHPSAANPVGETVMAVDDSVRHRDGVVAEKRDVAVFVDESFDRPPELWRADFGQYPRTADSLALINPGPAPAAGRIRHLSWTLPDGDSRLAALIFPAEVPVNARPPVIAWLYPALAGGLFRTAFGTFGGTGDEDVARFIAQGYAVLVPQIAEPSNRDGQSCSAAAADAVSALDAAGATGSIDASRAGLYGYSAGAYLTACIVTHTHRFRAGVVGEGYVDLTSAVMDLGRSMMFGAVAVNANYKGPYHYIDGTLWENPDLFIGNSPAFHADKVTTPLLLVYGKDSDTLMRDSQLRMYSALAGFNRPVQLVAYDGRDHNTVPTHPDYWPRVMGWFARYLAPNN